MLKIPTFGSAALLKSAAPGLSLFVRIVIFIENLNLSYLSRGEFCVSAAILDILIGKKTAR